MAKVDMLVHVGEKEKNKLFEKRLDQLFKQTVVVNSHRITSQTMFMFNSRYVIRIVLSGEFSGEKAVRFY